VLDGDPPIDLVIKAACTATPRLRRSSSTRCKPLITSEPGLHTMATIAPASCSDAGVRR